MIDQIVSRIREYKAKELELDFKEAAVLLAITRETSPSVVLTRRSDQLKTHRGQVAFPGGMQDPEDRSLVSTALREAHEEVGIHPDSVELVGSLDQVISKYEIKVTPYVGLIEPDIALTPCPLELDSVFKVPLEFFLETSPSRIDHLTFRGRGRDVPCWYYDDYEIWGMSALVLTDFFQITCEVDLTARKPF